MASQISQTEQLPLPIETKNTSTHVSNDDTGFGNISRVDSTPNFIESTPSNHVTNVNKTSTLANPPPSFANVSSFSSIYDSHRKITPAYQSLSSNTSSDSQHLLKNVGTETSKISADLSSEYENALCYSLNGLALKGDNPQAEHSNIHQIKLFESFANTSINATSPSSYANTTFPGFEHKLDQILACNSKSSSEVNYLMNKLCVLESNVNLEVAKLLNQIRELNERVSKVTATCSQQTESSMEFLETKSDARMDLMLGEKFREIDIHFDDTFTRIDNIISNKVKEMLTQLDDNNASQRLSADKSFDAKIEKLEKSIHDIVDVRVQYHVDKYLATKDFDFSSITKAVVSQLESSKINDFSAFQEDIKLSLSEHSRACKNLTNEIEDIKASINFLNDDNVSQTGGAVPASETKSLAKKIDQLSFWMSQLQLSFNNKAKQVDLIDVKTRKRNFIIEGLPESEENGDELYYEVCALLNSFIPDFNYEEIDNVYRLGKQTNSKFPRRVFVTVYSTAARERILSYAGLIAKSNEPGSRIFINEDVPDELKRRKSDVHKYVNFLKTKSISAIQKGDSVIINGILYKYEDLAYMKNGLSLKDSRTVFRNGVVAFQSHHSPLSNLFIAPIRRNGILYRSAEHAYQHAKALICKDSLAAQAILNEISPYDAMYIGKGIQSTREWDSLQLQTMEEILRIKLEQVPEFRDCLKSTANHSLVENTSSSYWGAGTTYNAESIFNNCYPGKNHLGKLLEKIREHF